MLYQIVEWSMSKLLRQGRSVEADSREFTSISEPINILLYLPDNMNINTLQFSAALSA